MDNFISFLIEHYYYSAPLLVLLILLIRSSAMKGGKKVTVQELISITNEGKAQLIDLRPSSEFNDGHITGSINIPFSDLENRSCLLYTSPSPRDQRGSRMPSSA